MPTTMAASSALPPCSAISKNMWAWRGRSSTPRRLGPLNWQRWIETFCLPVRGLRVIIRPARDVGAAVVLVVRRQRKQMLEIDLTMDDLLRRRRCRLPPRDRIERGVLKARQHLSGSTPIASAIQSRLETRPETTGIGCPPGRGNSVARSPSRRLAMAASSKRRPVPGLTTSSRSRAAR